jgi:hypothetical protein
MVDLSKITEDTPDGFVGEVSFRDKPEGEVIGTAKLEKVGDKIVVHIDATDVPEAVTKGFKLDPFSFSIRIQGESSE